MFWGNGQKRFILVQISVFRPKNARTKTFLNISLEGQNPRGGTLSASRIVSVETVSASGCCQGRHYPLADSVRGDTFCGGYNPLRHRDEIRLV